MSAPVTLTQGAFASHIGVKPGYVTELKKAGRLVMSADGRRVVVAESIALIEATRSPDKAHVSARHAIARGDEPPADDPSEDEGTPAYQTSRAIREHFAAETARMEYRQKAGELIELEVVRAAQADILAVLRNGLESLAAILAPQLAPVTEEAVVRARLADEIEIALGQVSDRFAEVGK